MPSTPKSLPANCQTCQVCGVSIDGEDNVHFNFGPSGSRERLHARVCRFATAAGCINEGKFTITAQDCYGKGNEIKVLPNNPNTSPWDRKAA